MEERGKEEGRKGKEERGKKEGERWKREWQKIQKEEGRKDRGGGGVMCTSVEVDVGLMMLSCAQFNGDDNSWSIVPHMGAGSVSFDWLA